MRDLQRAHYYQGKEQLVRLNHNLRVRRYRPIPHDCHLVTARLLLMIAAGSETSTPRTINVNNSEDNRF